MLNRAFPRDHVDLFLPKQRLAMYGADHQPECASAVWQGIGECSLRIVDVDRQYIVDINALVEYFNHAQKSDASWLRKEVAWHRVSEDSKRWEMLSSTMISDEGSYFYSASFQRWRKSEQRHSISQVRTQLQMTSTPEHATVGWTQIVWLSVDRVPLPGTEARGLCSSKSLPGMYAVRCPSGRGICYLAITKEHRVAQPSKLKFISISHHR